MKGADERTVRISKLVVASCTALLLIQTAQAQRLTLSQSWVGWVECKIEIDGDVKSTFADGTMKEIVYHEDRTHRWNLLPILTYAQGGATYSAASWTVTGGGHSTTTNAGKPDPTISWQIDGFGFPMVKIWRDSNNEVDIAESSSQLRTPDGTIVSDGNTAAAFEDQFPEIIVSAHQPLTPTTIAGGYDQPGSVTPGDITSTESCTWNLKAPVLLVLPSQQLTKPPGR
jgi:hypothetical protein